MSDVVTDTHALIWYLEDSPRLSRAANKAFEQCDAREIVAKRAALFLGLVYKNKNG